MTATSLRRKVADELARRVLVELGERVHSMVLFGSVARGEATPESDVDVLIITDDTLATKKQIHDISYDLECEHDFAFLIHTLRFTVDRLEAEFRMQSWLAQDMMQQGIVLYDDGTYRRLRVSSILTRSN